MMEAAAYLLGESYTTENHVQVTTSSRREIPVTVNSITQQEYRSAGVDGRKQEYRLETFWMNYEGEPCVELFGEVYTVYRTYLNGDTIELYLDRQGGRNAYDGYDA